MYQAHKGNEPVRIEMKLMQLRKATSLEKSQYLYIYASVHTEKLEYLH